jgi:hypothetical protein
MERRNIPKAEKKDDDESKADDTARDGGPNHSKRNLPRSILDLIGHVKDRIIPADGEDDSQQTNAPLNALILPSTLAVERRLEDKVRRAPPRHDDKHHDKHNEAEDVQDSRRNLNRRKDSAGVDVAEDGQGHRRPRQKHCVPALGDVRRVAQGDAALDHAAHEERVQGAGKVPGEDCEVALDEAPEARIGASRCQHGGPSVLCSDARLHGRQLGESRGHGGGSEDAEDHAVDECRGPAVDQDRTLRLAWMRGSDRVCPGRCQNSRRRESSRRCRRWSFPG